MNWVFQQYCQKLLYKIKINSIEVKIFFPDLETLNFVICCFILFVLTSFLIFSAFFFWYFFSKFILLRHRVHSNCHRIFSLTKIDHDLLIMPPACIWWFPSETFSLPRSQYGDHTKPNGAISSKKECALIFTSLLLD